MLAEGISDRFTRFVPSDQFSSMNSYDITGVGLNLSTAAELEGKTDIKATRVTFFSPLPACTHHHHSSNISALQEPLPLATTTHCSPCTTTDLTIVLEKLQFI